MNAPLALTSSSLVRRAGQNVSASIGPGRAINLSLTQGKYFELNAVATRILELLESPRRLGDLARLIAEEFDVTAEASERDTREFVERLVALGLAEVAGDG